MPALRVEALSFDIAIVVAVVPWMRYRLLPRMRVSFAID
jgi:hypothetical protein